MSGFGVGRVARSHEGGSGHGHGTHSRFHLFRARRGRDHERCTDGYHRKSKVDGSKGCDMGSSEFGGESEQYLGILRVARPVVEHKSLDILADS